MLTHWLDLLGGMALFTIGLSHTGESLKRIASSWVRNILLVITKNPLGSLILGIGTTLLAGSSSAITVMVVGFVSTGLLELRQALEVVLGAGIGTTLTVQLVSFNLIRYAPLLIFVGTVVMLVERSRGRAAVGPLALGFGLIFYGMMVMVGAVKTLSHVTWIRSGLLDLSHVPLAAFLVTLLFTALIQNSATVIALAITFRIHGLIPLSTGLEMVLGANVGSTAAAIYSALLGGSRSARRTAFLYALIKLSGAILFLLALPWYSRAVQVIDPAPARTLADGHTLFNVVNALLFLPLAGPLARLMERWLPDLTPPDVSRLDYDLITRPKDALIHAYQEIGRLSEIIRKGIIEPMPEFLFHPREDLERNIRQTEADVDILHHAITHYLFRVAHMNRLTETELSNQIKLLYLANHLEHLSDTGMKLMDTRLKLTRRNFSWPSDLWTAMESLLTRLVNQYQTLSEAIIHDDDDKALTLVQEHPDLLRAETHFRFFILTQPEESQSAYMTTLLELSDDLSLLISRIATVGRALMGIV